MQQASQVSIRERLIERELEAERVAIDAATHEIIDLVYGSGQQKAGSRAIYGVLKALIEKTRQIDHDMR